MGLRHKDGLKALVVAARAAGWTVAKRKRGHLKLTSPCGRVVFTGSTPSDWRANLNLRARLRRAGLEV